MKQVIAFFSALGMIGALVVVFLILQSSISDSDSICQSILDGHWIVLAPIVVACVSLVTFLCFLFKWIRQADHFNLKGQHVKLLGSTMFLLWTCGWLLYIEAFLSYNSVDNQFVDTEILLRSAVESIGLFMFNINSNVLDHMGDVPCLKGALSFVSVLAVSCTVGLLLSLVSARLRAYLSLLCSSVKKECPEVFVFFGLNEQTEVLAKSVKAKNPQSLIIVVEKYQKGDNDEDNGWQHVKGFLTHRRESFEKVKDIGACLSLTNVDISEIEIKQTDVFGEADLGIIKKRIRSLAKKGWANRQLHLFFLSDNEEKNILATAMIRKDETVCEACSKEVKVVVYCHARYDSFNRILEESNSLKNIDVRVIDSSRMSIEMLKRQVENHPVKFVEIDGKDNLGTVKSAFNSLVVGFGETGRDAVRFLYEYGAFMSNDSNNEHVQRSEFHCYAVDKAMDTKLGIFANSASEALKAKNADGTHLLQFLHADASSTAFYELLKNIGPTLNYVVIAMENDNEGMTLALRVMKCILSVRGSMKNVRILVRIRNNSHVEHFRAVTNHVNSSIAYVDGEKCLDTFGSYSDLFTYSFIVDDQFKKDAEAFYNRYQEVMGEDEQTLKNGSWDERRDQLLGFCKKVVAEIPSESAMQRYNEGKAVNEKMSPTGLYIKYEYTDGERLNYPKYKELRKLRRQTEQDMSNAWHRLTKRELMEEYLNKNITFAGLYQTITQLKEPGKGVEYRHKYDQMGGIGKLILNLAVTEHLRWIASHELLGYKTGEKTDEAKQEHNCLVGWQELNAVSKQACKEAEDYVNSGNWEEFDFSTEIKKLYPRYKEKVKAYVLYQPDYKRYDFAVVETTIALLKNEEEELIRKEKQEDKKI